MQNCGVSANNAQQSSEERRKRNGSEEDFRRRKASAEAKGAGSYERIELRKSARSKRPGRYEKEAPGTSAVLSI